MGSADAELLRLVDLVKSRSAFAASFKSVTAWVTSSSLASNGRDMAGICQYFLDGKQFFGSWLSDYYRVAAKKIIDD